MRFSGLLLAKRIVLRYPSSQGVILIFRGCFLFNVDFHHGLETVAHFTQPVLTYNHELMIGQLTVRSLAHGSRKGQVQKQYLGQYTAMIRFKSTPLTHLDSSMREPSTEVQKFKNNIIAKPSGSIRVWRAPCTSEALL